VEDDGTLSTQAKASLLEVMVESALQEHDLAPFEPAENSSADYQVVFVETNKGKAYCRIGSDNDLIRLVLRSAVQQT
jgi:hypothetical protein